MKVTRELKSYLNRLFIDELNKKENELLNNKSKAYEKELKQIHSLTIKINNLNCRVQDLKKLVLGNLNVNKNLFYFENYNNTLKKYNYYNNISLDRFIVQLQYSEVVIEDFPKLIAEYIKDNLNSN